MTGTYEALGEMDPLDLSGGSVDLDNLDYISGKSPYANCPPPTANSHGIANADEHLSMLQEQNQILETAARENRALFTYPADPGLFEPHFGDTGNLRFDTPLLGPNDEPLTQAADGTLKMKDDLSKTVELVDTKLPPTPPPPPANGAPPAFW